MPRKDDNIDLYSTENNSACWLGWWLMLVYSEIKNTAGWLLVADLF
jgi:hypothetical protein